MVLLLCEVMLVSQLVTSRAAAESYVGVGGGGGKGEEGTFCFFAFECVGKHIKSL